MIEDLFVDEQVILAAIALMSSFMTVMSFPNKIPPSGTPCHQDRSHSRHRYTHNQRDRLHSYYGPRQETFQQVTVPPFPS